MQSFTIKITQPGWETFSGDYCGYMFKNAVSTHPLPRNICDRIAALVKAEIIDENGENHGQGGAAARIAQRRDHEATVGVTLARMTDDAKAAELLKVSAEAGKAPTKEFYTAEQLDAVATQLGINGLRDLAKPWGVKDRSIPKLIRGIIDAQNKFITGRDKKLQDDREARAGALDAAKRSAIEAEQAFLKKARVIMDDETPNAIGPDGKAVYYKELANGADPKSKPAEGQS